ncbi:MAG TPA: PAS domain S-box protein [Acidimicrobiales bacterium]|nr:PAS domain S-box protein [Acidimicrobiales bacterium]
MSERIVTIVLVDDASDVRALVRSRLQLTNRFKVVGEGANGAEAETLAAELKPDLMLLDVSMPDVDGLDALAKVRAASPDTRIVMFSGFEEQGLADRARELGAVDFIEKSIPIGQLADRLMAAVGAAPVDSHVLAPGPEALLQEHRERFRAAFDEAAIGMATLTLTGGIVRANEAFGELVGTDSIALVGASYDSLVDVPRRDALLTIIGDIAGGRRDVASLEHRMADRDVVTTLAVVRDSNRSPLYLFLQVQDVSDQRAAEEDLRRSEEQFRLLVESVGDYAIFMLDAGGHIASWNLGAQRAKGYQAEEVLGRHFSIFYPPEAVASGHPEYELEIASTEGRYEEEGWRVRKDGSYFWANVVITALRNKSGRLVGFAKVTRDVTERKELLERLEQAALERTQLLAVTAHELRTPVAVVTGFATTLADHWQDLDQQERVDMLASMRRGGERLSRLVDDLFTAARLETGALEFKPAPFELAALLAEVAEEVTDGEVRVDAAPMMVLADRGRTQQMVSNYVTNAMRHGAGPILISAEMSDGAARVAVSDSGPGVSEALVPRLFKKFSGGGGQESTGLGLFIVRELARAQGGDAWYESASDGGAVFALRLPLAPERI